MLLTGLGCHSAADIGLGCHSAADIGLGCHSAADIGLGCHSAADIGLGCHSAADIGLGCHSALAKPEGVTTTSATNNQRMSLNEPQEVKALVGLCCFQIRVSSPNS